ncbi:11779_t:CDS:2 [Paraglomus brasilianum]|uniref:11779_t:CDS:1 n=1 Tax=Paraglomus brasilianum TaxID=144538 RepID=A0A9N8WIT4_9GLOM|nr:11779_t:CDS:2 [Paraglomus brasilianum]
MYCDDSKEACEWHSEKEDVVQKIKELMESEEGTYIDSLIFVADKTGGILTFVKYNVDFLLLILTVICFLWFLFSESFVSRTSLHIVGGTFLFRLTKYVELPFANYFKSLTRKDKTE